MDDANKLNENLGILSEYITESLTSSGDLIKQELPLVAQEIIFSKIIMHSTLMSLSLIFFVVSFLLYRLFLYYKGIEGNSPVYRTAIYTDPSSESKNFSRFFSYMASCIGVVILVCNLHGLLYTICCPRLVILDYLKSMIGA